MQSFFMLTNVRMRRLIRVFVRCTTQGAFSHVAVHIKSDWLTVTETHKILYSAIALYFIVGLCLKVQKVSINRRSTVVHICITSLTHLCRVDPYCLDRSISCFLYKGCLFSFYYYHVL